MKCIVVKTVKSNKGYNENSDIMKITDERSCESHAKVNWFSWMESMKLN